MVKVGNQGLDDRYIRLQSHRISHPVVSGLHQSHSITFSRPGFRPSFHVWFRSTKIRSYGKKQGHKSLRKRPIPLVIVDPALFRQGRCMFHVHAILLCKPTRVTTLPVQPTVYASTAILYSPDDVLNADDGTIHSFACPCGSGFAVFGSAYIESRKRR